MDPRVLTNDSLSTESDNIQRWSAIGAEQCPTDGRPRDEVTAALSPVARNNDFWVHTKDLPAIAVTEEEKLAHKSLHQPRAGRSLLSRLYAALTAKLNNRSFRTSRSIPKTRLWRTRLIRFGPLSGIFALVIAIVSIVASLGVLAGSNDSPTASWSAPPSTYLAICTAVANLAIRYAAIQGVVICWWSRALSGSSLAKLHWDWRSGTTLRGALTAGRHTGILGLACIFSTIVVIDGPLLQRSSTVRSASITGQSVTLNSQMAPQIPHSYSGNWVYGQMIGSIRWNTAFNATIPSADGSVPNDISVAANHSIEGRLGSLYTTDAPLSQVFSGCKQTCKATLTAPALARASCLTKELTVDYTRRPARLPSVNGAYGAAPLEYNAISIASTLVVGNVDETIQLFTAFATNTDCVGMLKYTTCSLVSATAEYEVNIDPDGARLINPARPKIIALAANTKVNRTLNPDNIAYDSTLGGIANLFSAKSQSNLALFRLNGTTSGLNFNALGYYPYQLKDNADCPSFSDPQEDMLASLNKLMVYTGMLAAEQSPAYLEARMDPGMQVNTTTVGEVTGSQSVYHVDYMYFLAAVLVEVICIVLIAPTYWGWWKIGRPVSFSPLEFAKAFEAPILAPYNSNSSGRDLAKVVGDVHVRYGETMGGQTSMLAFGDPASTSTLKSGTRFSV